MKTTKSLNGATERGAIQRNSRIRMVSRFAVAALGLFITVGATQHASAQTIFIGDWWWFKLRIAILSPSPSQLQISNFEATGQSGVGVSANNVSLTFEQPVLLAKNFTPLQASSGVSRFHDGIREEGLPADSVGQPLGVLTLARHESEARMFNQVATDGSCRHAMGAGARNALSTAHSGFAELC